MTDKPNPSSKQQTLTIQEALNLAVRHHSAGELSEAKSICHQILQTEPNQVEALHLLGVIAYHEGKFTVAVECLTKSLALKPDYAEAHNTLGSALRALGLLHQASLCYQKAIDVKLDFHEAQKNLEALLEEMNQSRNPFLLNDTLSINLPIIEIMDIGAMPEGVDRYNDLVLQELGRVTGFEPNPDSLDNLKNRKGPYKYLPYFLGNGKKSKFHVTRYRGCSSLLEPNGDVINLFSTLSTELEGNFTVVETIDVETIRLDDIRGINKPDYVKIDVQGAELMIMENAVNTFSNVVVLETEVEFISLYKEQPLFGDIQKFLIDKGFIFHKLIDVSGRGLRPLQFDSDAFKPFSQVLWADAIFVRDYTNLRSFKDEELLKASLILNDIYKSYDLVVYLLNEYDKRQGTDLAQIYLSAVKKVDKLDLLFMNLKTGL